MADKQALEIKELPSELCTLDESNRQPDPDRMPVDLQRLMLQIPGLKLSDVIEFADWQHPRRFIAGQ